MKLRWKVLAGTGIVLATLLTVNAFVVDSETREAEPTLPSGRIERLSGVELQLLDLPPRSDRPRRVGAPVVLLHGYATSLQWFERLAPRLNLRHRVVSLDLIGHGGSEKPASGFTIAEQAGAVAEALNRLGVEGAVVVGHSMGGYVAAELADRASELVDRVAVLGTPADAEGSELPLLAELTYAPVLGEALWRLRPAALIRSGYDSAFAPGFDPEAAFADPDRVVDDNRAMTYSSYEGSQDAARDFIEAESMVSRLTRSAVPVLAVFGAEDELVEPERAAGGYEAIPGAEVRLLAGVGHSPQVEAPARTAELLLRFAGTGVRAGRAQSRSERGRAGRAG